MEKYTLEQALDDSIAIWETMERSGFSNKQSAIHMLGLKQFLNSCPLCEYAKVLKGKLDYFVPDCSLCPWPGEKLQIARCEGAGSAYAAWQRYNSTHNAHKMVELLEGLKQKLIDNKNKFTYGEFTIYYNRHHDMTDIYDKRDHIMAMKGKVTESEFPKILHGYITGVNAVIKSVKPHLDNATQALDNMFKTVNTYY